MPASAAKRRTPAAARLARKPPPENASANGGVASATLGADGPCVGHGLTRCRLGKPTDRDARDEASAGLAGGFFVSANRLAIAWASTRARRPTRLTLRPYARGTPTRGFRCFPTACSQ